MAPWQSLHSFNVSQLQEVKMQQERLKEKTKYQLLSAYLFLIPTPTLTKSLLEVSCKLLSGGNLSLMKASLSIAKCEGIEVIRDVHFDWL